MTLSLLVAIALLRQPNEIAPLTQRWADWLRAHTQIAQTSDWTQWTPERSQDDDPTMLGFISPSRDRVLTLDGRIVPYLPPSSKRPSSFCLGPEPLRLESEAGVAVLLARGRQAEALTLNRRLTTRDRRREIEHAIAMHVSARFSLALASFGQRQDDRALRMARALAEDLPSLKAIVDVEAIPRSEYDPLAFAESLPNIIKELERRTKGPRQGVTPTLDLQHTSVPEMIEALEDVSSIPRSVPGGPWYNVVPLVQALARRGEEAVPALLDAAEWDGRLTRGWYSDDYSYGFHFVRVASLAHATLQAIAHLRDFPGERRADGTEDPKAARRFFEATRGQNPAQRALFLLRTEAAEPLSMSESWIEAVGMLLAPKTTLIGHASPLDDLLVVPRTSDLLTPDERGELIRILDRRVAEAGRAVPDDSTVQLAAVLAYGRAILQPKEAEPLLKLATDLSRTYLRSQSTLVNSARPIAKVFLRRVRTGDPDAEREFTSWLQILGKRETSPWPDLAWLAPLQDLETNAKLRPAAQWVLSDPESPWRRDGLRGLVAWGEELGPLPSLVRRAFARELQATQPVGTVKSTENDQVEISLLDGRGWSTDPGESFGLPPGKSQPIRRNDLFASNWSYRSGVPFSLGWPISRRDEAIREMSRRLAQEAARSR